MWELPADAQNYHERGHIGGPDRAEVGAGVRDRGLLFAGKEQANILRVGQDEELTFS
jgi:hypothetical protein